MTASVTIFFHTVKAWDYHLLLCSMKTKEKWMMTELYFLSYLLIYSLCLYLYQNSLWTDLINEYLLEKTTKAPSQPTLPGPPPPPPEEQDIQPADPPPRSRRSAPVLVSRGAAPHTSLSSVKGKPTVSVVVLSVAVAAVTIIIFHAFLKPLRNSSPHNFYSPLSGLPGFHNKTNQLLLKTSPKPSISGGSPPGKNCVSGG